MEQILELIAQYPVVSSILVVVGALRLVFKPVMTAIQAIVAVTPSKKDDEVLAKAEASSIYKAIVWVIDYLASIKLPVKK